MDTIGKATCYEQNLTSRQQLHVDDNRKLAGFLNFETEKVKKYDVFVFELCEGNKSRKRFLNGDAKLSIKNGDNKSKKSCFA